MPNLTISDGPPRDMSNFIVVPKILFGFSKEGHIFWFCTPKIGQNFINYFSYSYKFTRYCKKNVAILFIISLFSSHFWKYSYQFTTSLQRAITLFLRTILCQAIGQIISQCLGQKFVQFFVGFLENLRNQKDILKLTDL